MSQPPYGPPGQPPQQPWQQPPYGQNPPQQPYQQHPVPYQQPMPHPYQQQPMQPQVVYYQQPQHGTQVSKQRMGGSTHTIHLVLTIVTCGMWLPVWALIAILSRKKTVTRY